MENVTINPISNNNNDTTGAAPGLDVQTVRSQFPILNQKINGKPLVYFDNAATTQKPKLVLDALDSYYKNNNANIHRAVHTLSQSATALYDGAREKIQKFIGANTPQQIIYTRGTTESINLVAAGAASIWLKEGDEVLISRMEHHSNIVPWQLACQRSGATLKAVPITWRGELDMQAFDELLTKRTKFVSLVHLSNALGTLNPVKQIIEKAHAFGAKVLIDGAQSVPHLPLNVEELGVDFYAFSGHKIYGPTGIGILYGKKDLLDELPPYQGGGDMIDAVTIEKTVYAELPSKFEAGTPHIAGAVGLGAALDFVLSIGLKNIAAHEHELMQRATEKLEQIKGVRIIGTADKKGAAISFVVDDPPIASLDIGQQLDLAGIAVRTGHHCCQPAMDSFGINSTTRVSFAVYNSLEEVDIFADALEKIISAARKKGAGASSAVAAPKGQSQDKEIIYPPASNESVAAAAQELEDLFSLVEDWPSRYEAIIDMGDKLFEMDDSLKTEQTFVKGCQSIVYIAARQRPDSEDIIEFLADSDANIVRGLIAVLQKIYNGQRASEVLDFDAESFLSKLGFDNNLSMTRRNGLQAMVQRIRKVAREIAD